MRPIRLLLLIALGTFPRVVFPQGGAPLGPEFRVNTFTTLAQSAPALGSDGAGDFVVVWQSLQEGSGYGVFGQRYAGSGVPLGPEFRANTFTTGNQIAPAVASDAIGNFVVLWQSEAQDGSGLGVFGQRFTGSGVPVGPEFRVNSFTTGDQFAPSLSFDKVSNFFAVWTSDGQDGSATGVFGQRFASFGVPLGPEFRVNTQTAAGQRFPSIAGNIAGDFVIAWESEAQDGSNFGVFGQRYASSGVPLGSEFRVNTFTTQNQITPAVAATTNNFVVAWQSQAQDGSDYGVFGQRYSSSGAPLGAEFRVNGSTAGYQLGPAVAADITVGAFVVAWESANQDGSGAGIFGQRYASSGLPLGAEFRVNTYTTNGQRRAAVGSSFSGNFVVVWQSDLQDGSGYGVFGQRFSPIVPVELMHFRVE